MMGMMHSICIRGRYYEVVASICFATYLAIIAIVAIFANHSFVLARVAVVMSSVAIPQLLYWGREGRGE